MRLTAGGIREIHYHLTAESSRNMEAVAFSYTHWTVINISTGVPWRSLRLPKGHSSFYPGPQQYPRGL
ncbi:hypothetical protein RSOLAG1IB_02029 [Rhizoctonia solani AG-1 IB]|uniref:Uncharacterized protein n=1 Tax=Thanatephorus cucumeris (strain AG1-IB / isolate 7/3/14) TaxID=1108050 RepID=A0A0B7FEH5_THACB|nr:hypothetical protein RSOLAG1IB_02029 [Rhizoctonia solani AG-1 IB]